MKTIFIIFFTSVHALVDMLWCVWLVAFAWVVGCISGLVGQLVGWFGWVDWLAGWLGLVGWIVACLFAWLIACLLVD